MKVAYSYNLEITKLLTEFPVLVNVLPDPELRNYEVKREPNLCSRGLWYG